ncbi:MAG: ArsC family (seleno)protein [Myxococcota bacterium]
MAAKDTEVSEKISASKKLGAEDAQGLLKGKKRLVVAKGKKVTEFKGKELSSDEARAAMLGPTGNLRAPTLIVGDTVIVGFAEEALNELLS